jgi:hypothetical protein
MMVPARPKPDLRDAYKDILQFINTWAPEERVAAYHEALNVLYGEAVSANEELEATKARLRPLAEEVRRYSEAIADARALLQRALGERP